MPIASRTPEGSPNRCTVCGAIVVIEPSRPPGDAPCPACGHLLWFPWFPPREQLRIVCERVESFAPEDAAFEGEAWRTGSMRLRGAQVSDLIRRCLLIGLTDAQVVALLGEPDERAQGWLGYALYRGVRVTYRGSPHRLRVRFSAASLVSEASIVER
jgi:hypothetical protein